MSYKQDLARQHKERLLRMRPVQSAEDAVRNLTETVSGLKFEIIRLEAKRDRLKAIVRELGVVKEAEVRGERALIALRNRVCADHDMPVEVFVGPGRSQIIVIARRQFAQEARAKGFSCQRIGYHIGGRDHSTVLNYIKPKTLLSNRGRYVRETPDAEPMVG